MEKNKLGTQWLWFIYLTLLILCICQPLHHDEAVFLIMGNGLKHGLLPYKDLFDHKSPGIYYLAWGLSNFKELKLIVAIRSLIFMLNTVTAGIIVYSFKDKKIQKEGGWLVLGYLILSQLAHGHYFMSAAFANFGVVTSLLTMKKISQKQSLIWWFVSGTGIGLAGFFKQTYLILIVPMLFTLFMFNRNLNGVYSKLSSIFVMIGGISWIWLIWVVFVMKGQYLSEALGSIFTYHVNYLPQIGFETLKLLIFFITLLPLVIWLTFQGIKSTNLGNELKLIHFTSVAYLLFLIPIGFYRPYHHYYFQILPMIMMLTLIGLEQRPHAFNWLKLNLLLCFFGLAIYGYVSLPMLKEQLTEAKNLKCGQTTTLQIQALKQCLPQEKYFY